MSEEKVTKSGSEELEKSELQVDKEAVKDLEMPKDQSNQVKGGGIRTGNCGCSS